MLRKLSTLILCLVAAVATASAQTPPDNEIWYTTTVGSKIHINTNNLVSNSYNNGRGVLKFRDRVTSIGDWTFYGCYSLKSITIPESVTYIGNYAFAGCISLTSITIPESVTEIGDSAFVDCISLTSITIPDGVTEIGEYAFFGCSSLKSITISESVTRIGKSAFSGCSSLKSITIPNSVISIEVAAFYRCSSLKSVKVSNKYCYDYFKEKVTDIVFYGANATTDGRCLIVNGELQQFIGKGVTQYSIPESVTSIGEDAFYGCSSLTSITIPEKVTSIGDDAFKDCLSLISITIPESVTIIGNEAFEGCTNLRSITIPEGVNSIGYFAFLGCSSLKSFKGKFTSTDGRCLIKDGKLIAFAPAGLTSYTIPESVTSIGEDAFAWCHSLTSITIPNSVTYIGDAAFAGCSSLKSITIPDSVTEIGDYAFYGCSSLTSIAIPNSVTIIREHAFYGCSSLKRVKVSNKYCYDYFKKLGVSDITFMVSTLEEYEEAQKLGVTKIVIDSKYASEDGLCLIDKGELILFIGKDLTKYTIPEGVTSFRKEAFKGCSSLTSITIPKSVTSIGEDAFEGCSSLTSITCLATTPPAISYISSKKTTLIYIPKKAVKAYKKDPKWSIYKKQIKPIK